MEEKDILLTEIKRQNQYLKRQLFCIRILTIIFICVMIGIGIAICVGYPKVREAVNSASNLGKKADEMMTGIQTMSDHADEVILQADEMLENLEPKMAELENFDMKAFIENLNDLNEGMEALNLEEFKQTMQDIQKALNALDSISELIQ